MENEANSLLTLKLRCAILIPVELIPPELTNGGETMAKRIEGVTEKLLECAKEEFLAKIDKLKAKLNIP